MAFDLDNDELRAIRKSKGLDDGLYEEKAKLVSQIATNFGIDFTEAKMMIEQSLMNFGKEFSMSETDKMFIKNGWTKIIREGIEEFIDDDNNYIHFDLVIERFTCNCYLSAKELQAINMKCKELGWLE